MGRWRKGGREEGGKEKYRIESSDEGFNTALGFPRVLRWVKACMRGLYPT